MPLGNLYGSVRFCFVDMLWWYQRQGGSLVECFMLHGRHMPTLKKQKDDMTKAGVVVNMLAVHRRVYRRGHLCLSSSIG